MYKFTNGILEKIEEPKAPLSQEETYFEKRSKEYGSPSEQLEFIIENGIEKFIEKQKSIKEKYPKI